MRSRSIQILALVFAVLLACVGGSAQSADNRSNPFSGNEDSRDKPRSYLEMLQRLRIERENKDHDEMVERGDEAFNLSVEIEHSFTERGGLSDADQDKLETIEKNLKKIRSELGGDDNDQNIDEILNSAGGPTIGDAITTLRSTAADLNEDLKKTTRFTISAGAIQMSNTAIKLVRFLRSRK